MKADLTTLQQPPIRRHDSWAHQLAGYHFAMPKAAAYLAASMGTGKSKIAVDLVCNRDCKSVLILCPKSVLGVWRGQFSQHAGAMCNVVILDRGTVGSKTKEADQAMMRHSGQPAVVVINYESAWRPEFAAWSLGRKWDCVILDEAHRVKGNATAISKYAAKLTPKSRERLCLSGTPMPHSPLDLYGQCRFLEPTLLGSSWHAFRHKYAILINIPGVIAPVVKGYKNLDELTARFESIAFRVGADVLDLPPTTEQEIECELSPAARKIYRDMEEELIADIGSGAVSTAANALVRIVRLQQITSGYLPEEETKTAVEIDSAKREALGDLIDGLPPSEPVVVFCKFRHDLDQVRQVAANLSREYGELSGRRKDLTPHATMPDSVNLMAVQLQSGEVGVDLTRACYCVYYSTGCITPGQYDQSLARVHRPGQTRTTHYYHLVCRHTVDERVYKALKERRDIVDSILNELKH